MPNWKKLIVSGSDAALNSLNVTSALTASGLNYPTSDGTDGQVLLTDGSGELTFGDNVKYVTVKNVSSGTLTKGTPVHSTGTSGNAPEVIAASASLASAMPANFVLAQNISAGAEGRAVLSGFLNGVDTNGFDAGSVIYVAPTGSYTNTKPEGDGNLIQNVAIVGSVGVNGSLFVYGSGRSNDVPNLPEGKIWVGSSNYTVTSSVAHLDESNGRLGIGTNSPTQKLDVRGNILISGSSNALFIKGDGSKQAKFSHDGAGLTIEPQTQNQDLSLGSTSCRFPSGIKHYGGDHIFYTGSASSEAVRIDKDTGYLGIGTNNPSEALSVEGNTCTSGLTTTNTLTVTGLSNQGSEATALMINGSNVVGTRELGSNAFNSTAFTTCTGTVTCVGGQGTVSGLTLTGNTSTSGSLTLGGTFSTTTSSITNFNTGVGTIIDGCGFTDCTGTVTGAAGSNTQVQYNNGGNFAGSSNLTFDGTNLTVGGKVTATEIVTNVVSQSISFATGSNRFGDEITDTHTFTGSLNVTGSLGVTGNLTISAGHIETDQIYLADKILHSGDSDTYIAFENNTHRYFAAGEEMIKFNSSLITLNEAGGNNDIRIKGNSDTNLFYSDGSADKIGIGTITPDEKLTVEGNISASGNFIGADITGSSLNLSSVVNAGTDTDKFLVLDSDGNVDFRTGANVLSDIGATTCTGTVTGTGAVNKLAIWNSSTALTSDTCLHWDTSNDRLGIGTITPTQKLHISGSATDVGIRIDNSATNGRDWFLYSRAASGVKFSIYDFDASADRLGIDENGNVGIGTITPTQKLTVEGNISGSGCIQIGTGHTLSGTKSSIGGGINHTITGNCSFIGGGCDNCITGNCSFVGGGRLNDVLSTCSVIAGGYDNSLSATVTAIAGGRNNCITSTGACSFIGGGYINKVQCLFSTIGGGCSNCIQDAYSFIGGGIDNCTNSSYWHNVIGGGHTNTISGTYSGYNTIGGGCNNSLSGTYSSYQTIAGGIGNCITANSGFIGGGGANKVCGNNGAIVGGNANTICNGEQYAFIGGGRGHIVDGDCSTIAGGAYNCITANAAIIAGGTKNTGSGECGFIGGGCKNDICSGETFAFIGGGFCNIVDGDFTNIVGGCCNKVVTPCSVIGGGACNIMCQTSYGVIAGGLCNFLNCNSPGNGCFNTIGGGCNNQMCAQSGGAGNTIAGGKSNSICADSAGTIGGGCNNLVCTFAGVVAGGSGNKARSNYASVGGGYCNDVCDGESYGTIAGGKGNIVDGDCSTIAGGALNCITANAVIIAGGILNTGSAACGFIGGGSLNNIRSGKTFTTIGGGESNSINSNHSSILGGRLNNINSGNCSFIGGGCGNTLSGYYLNTIVGGKGNTVSNYATCQTIVGGVTNTISGGGSGIIGAGTINSIGSGNSYGAIVAGHCNTLASSYNAISNLIGSGFCNSISSAYPQASYFNFIGSGCRNKIFNGTNSSGYGRESVLSSAIVAGTLNTASAACSFIGGGCLNSVVNSSIYANIIGGQSNTINSGSHSNIVGGINNRICSAKCSSILGGKDNFISGSGNTNSAYHMIIGGLQSCIKMNEGLSTLDTGGVVISGYNNLISAGTGFIGVATNSTVSGYQAAVLSGDSNTVSGCYSTNTGGRLNCVTGCCSAVVNGCRNCVTSEFAFIGGGKQNTGSGDCSTIGGGALNYASGTATSIVGGYYNRSLGNFSSIVGGCNNTVESAETFSFVGGGRANCLDGDYSVIGGGYSNQNKHQCSVVAGGYANCVCSCQSTIGGGFSNLINVSGDGRSTIGGGYNSGISGTCGYHTIAGGSNNCVNTTNNFNTIGGGQNNDILCNIANSTIAGGASNTICRTSGFDYGSFIGGGAGNCLVTGNCWSTISGGYLNCSTSNRTFIGGGTKNTGSGACSTIGGGCGNTASGTVSTVGGGKCNTASGTYSGILGGTTSTVSHTCSFIVGSNLTSTAACYTFMNNACVAGTTRTTTLVETSARRFKECILPLQDQIQNIKKLEPVEFQWKKDKTKDIGFIAEDVLKVYPDLIAYEEDGEINGIQYSKLTTVLVKALQQQQKQINELEQEIKVLKQK